MTPNETPEQRRERLWNLYVINTDAESERISIINAMIAVEDAAREQTVNECRDELLKQMHIMTYENTYPTYAVAKATLLSLPALMKVRPAKFVEDAARAEMFTGEQVREAINYARTTRDTTYTEIIDKIKPPTHGNN